jgi:hypothetical protein
LSFRISPCRSLGPGSRATAAFLALRYRPRETMANLAALEEKIPGMFGQWGFADSVNVDTKHVSGNYLSLDQGMIMAALGNELGDDVLREASSTPDTRRALRPVIGVEEFDVGVGRGLPQPATDTSYE